MTIDRQKLADAICAALAVQLDCEVTFNANVPDAGELGVVLLDGSWIDVAEMVDDFLKRMEAA